MTPGAESREPTFYDAVGGEAPLRRIVARFYVEVAHDEVLRPLYPEQDLAPAEERMALFLIQVTGGPRTYAERRGPPGLRGRHMRFPIGRRERDAWLRAMRVAVEESGMDEPDRRQLWEYFETTAYGLTNRR